MTICLNICVNGVYGPHTASILQSGSYTDKSESSIVHIIYTPGQMKVHIHGQHSRGRSLVGAPYLYSAERRKSSVTTVSSSENSLFRKYAALPFGQLRPAKVALY